jgi:hypothetical protein
MPPTINDLVKRGAKIGYRKVEFKRVRLDGTYEVDWFDISQFVQSYGSMNESYGDNLILGEYQPTETSIILDNSRRRFNDANESESLFHTFKTRIKTRFRIEVGFIDPDGFDDEIVGRRSYGIMTSEPVTSDAGLITLKISSILNVFKLHNAANIVPEVLSTPLANNAFNVGTDEFMTIVNHGLVIDQLIKLKSGAPATPGGDLTFEIFRVVLVIGIDDIEVDEIPANALNNVPVFVSVDTPADLINRLVKKVQNGVRVFDQFFEGSDDATRYQIQATPGDVIISPTIKDNVTIWDKIKDYSLYENFYPGVTFDGNFEWRDRVPVGGVVFRFNGAGSFDNEFGINIVRINSEEAGVDQTWTRAVIEHADDRFAVSESVWTPGDGSIQDIFGERTFDADLKELDAGLAQVVADRVISELGLPKRRWRLQTVFIPHLRLNDPVEINNLGESSTATPFILGVSILGTDRLGERTGSINLNQIQVKVQAVSINVNSFETEYELVEV